MGSNLHVRWLAQNEGGHQLGVLGTPFEEAWRKQLQRHPIDVQLIVVLLSDLSVGPEPLHCRLWDACACCAAAAWAAAAAP